MTLTITEHLDTIHIANREINIYLTNPNLYYSIACTFFGNIDFQGKTGYEEAICVDSKFINLDDATQSGIIAHEIGHILCKHHNNCSQFKSVCNMLARNILPGQVYHRITKMELEADYMGASIVGVDIMIDTLQKTLSLPGVKEDELIVRIDDLKNYKSLGYLK